MKYFIDYVGGKYCVFVVPKEKFRNGMPHPDDCTTVCSSEEKIEAEELLNYVQAALEVK